MTWGGQSRWLFKAYASPSSARPLFQAAVGNLNRRRRVLTETVARQRSSIIGADKLPPECRSVTRRKLTQMEALERDAIVP